MPARLELGRAGAPGKAARANRLADFAALDHD
jgi:hypothetical protein